MWRGGGKQYFVDRIIRFQGSGERISFVKTISTPRGGAGDIFLGGGGSNYLLTKIWRIFE